VDERRRLKRVPGPLLPQVPGSQPPQLRICHLEQLLPGVLIAVAPRGEHLGKTSARLHTLAECSAGPIAVSCFVGVVRC